MFNYGGGMFEHFWFYNNALTCANDNFSRYDCIEIIDNWRNTSTKIKWVERTPVYEMDNSGGPGRLSGFMPD
jgi:hypothetical protein